MTLIIISHLFSFLSFRFSTSFPKAYRHCRRVVFHQKSPNAKDQKKTFFFLKSTFETLKILAALVLKAKKKDLTMNLFCLNEILMVVSTETQTPSARKMILASGLDANVKKTWKFRRQRRRVWCFDHLSCVADSWEQEFGTIFLWINPHSLANSCLFVFVFHIVLCIIYSVNVSSHITRRCGRSEVASCRFLISLVAFLFLVFSARSFCLRVKSDVTPTKSLVLKKLGVELTTLGPSKPCFFSFLKNLFISCVLWNK